MNRHHKMLRLAPSGVLMLLSTADWWAPAAMAGGAVGLLTLAAYAVGAIWWLVILARARRAEAWLMFAAWVPALVPVIALVRALRALEHDDVAALAIVAIAPACLLVVLACGGVCVLVAEDRRTARRTGAPRFD